MSEFVTVGKAAFAACFALLSVSCATLQRVPTYHLAVDSISAEDHKGASMYVYPGESSVSPDDLLFREFSADVKFALSRQGFRLADSIESADQVVFLSYGISDPERQVVSVPHYGRTGVTSARTTGTQYDFNGFSGFDATTTYEYDYGVTGYRDVQRTVYHRIVLLSAYSVSDYANSGQMVQEWETIIRSSGSSGDLRRVFPVLMTGAEPFLATNTGQAVEMRIKESDPRIQAFKNH